MMLCGAAGEVYQSNTALTVQLIVFDDVFLFAAVFVLPCLVSDRSA